MLYGVGQTWAELVAARTLVCEVVALAVPTGTGIERISHSGTSVRETVRRQSTDQGAPRTRVELVIALFEQLPYGYVARKGQLMSRPPESWRRTFQKSNWQAVSEAAPDYAATLRNERPGASSGIPTAWRVALTVVANPSCSM